MLSTWSNKEDCCEWRGVQCDITGRVTNLNLPCFTNDFVIGINKNKTHCLTGELHLSLFELEFLNYLNLSNNDFKAIHSSLDRKNLSLDNNTYGKGNFSNVVHLDLSGNENLAVDDLKWLLRLSSSLEYLNFDFIDLRKENHWLQILTMLPSLSELHLSSCLLESANPSLQFANFTSLEYLDLSDNDFFSELPNWLFNLSGLYHLNLGENRFHGQIPETLLNLRNLQVLILQNNKLSGTIPNWLGQLGGLNELDFSWNLFTSSIPITLGNFSSLTILSVANNHLTGNLPESLGQLSNLEELYVGGNSLSGIVSGRNFVKLSKLSHLELDSPFFIFDFDAHWIPPFALQLLSLSYADLNLVPWLYTHTSLNYLSITKSLFTIKHQENFWSLAKNIRHLFIYDNSMHWDMSNVLLNSEVIWLKGNGLKGGLPMLTSNVNILGISDNYLSGSLAPLLCNKKMNSKSNLQYLNIFNNSLSQGLTDCWKNLGSLVHVNLGRNNLTGVIPHSIGTLSNMFSLHLDHNNFHGEIPSSLKNCKKMMILNLGENKFSGSIPNWIGHDMKALRLRSNEFSGVIPLQICQLSSLIVLDLANNKLSGTIPHCLNNITSMVLNNASKSDIFGIQEHLGIQFLFTLSLQIKGNELYYEDYAHVIDLSNNHLFGKIPLEVCKLTALLSLNLSHNQLKGTIPKEIGNMKQLESLDFSNNTLYGEIPLSMSALTFLEALNLSFNNLKGQIPLGTQLQSFKDISYMGNPKLCGAPLIKKCNCDETCVGDTKLMANDENGSELLEWFYMGMGVGFAISFLIVFCSLLFKRTWRHAYFKFLDDVTNQFMSRWY